MVDQNQNPEKEPVPTPEAAPILADQAAVISGVAPVETTHSYQKAMEKGRNTAETALSLAGLGKARRQSYLDRSSSLPDSFRHHGI